MSKKIFLFKDNSSADDRDCVAYTYNEPLRFECGHYFYGVLLYGAAYCSSDLSEKLENYDNFTTLLTKEEFRALVSFSDAMSGLGYGMDKGDFRYRMGVALCELIQPIYDKLRSPENDRLFEKVIEEEKEYVQNEYSLTREEVDEIFKSYAGDYRDRAIVQRVWDSIHEAAEEECEALGHRIKENARWFDVDAYGRDLLLGEEYIELASGNVVRLAY